MIAETSAPSGRRDAIVASSSGSAAAKTSASAMRKASGSDIGAAPGQSNNFATSPIEPSINHAAWFESSGLARAQIGANALSWRNSSLPSRTSSREAENEEARAGRPIFGSTQ